jgi:hypothetical protein
LSIIDSVTFLHVAIDDETGRFCVTLCIRLCCCLSHVCITNFSSLPSHPNDPSSTSGYPTIHIFTPSPRRPPNVFSFLLVLQYYIVHACLLWLPHLMTPWLLRYCNGNHYFPTSSPNQLVETASWFIGYPNVGKSSVINTLKSGKVCRVAPVPGEMKVSDSQDFLTFRLMI